MFLGAEPNAQMDRSCGLSLLSIEWRAGRQSQAHIPCDEHFYAYIQAHVELDSRGWRHTVNDDVDDYDERHILGGFDARGELSDPLLRRSGY